MFSNSVLDENKAMEERWQQRCAELYGGREFRVVTDSGIEVKPVYTPADINGIEYKDIGLPGEYPFTRGHSPLQYQVKPWMMRIALGLGNADDTRRREEFLASLGMSQGVGTDRPAPCTFVADYPTMRGYDPDEPAAWGWVGRDGVSISTMRDMEAMFDGSSLDEMETVFVAHDTSMACFALYIAYAKRRGVPQHKLRAKCNNQLYRWFADQIPFSPHSAMKLIAELIKYCHDFLPLVRPQCLIGYSIAEAGATAVQEVALFTATAVAITEECMKTGLEPDDIVSRLYGHEHVSMNFLEQIAKFRARRRLWAKVFKEKFGCNKLESLCCWTSTQTGGSMLVAQEPLNNIIRVTIMALASVLAGVEGLFTVSHDEALAIPTEEAAQIAVRIQQILYHETDIANAIDPLGGSYYIEWLTSRIEDEATKILQEIDKRGGYLKCWEDGWFMTMLQSSFNERQRKIDNGEKVIVGLNRYRLPEQPRVQAWQLDPNVEEEAIARVRKFKADRDQVNAARALTEVRAAAQRIAADWPDSCGCLMPAMIEAFMADATVGEVQRTLQEVLGYGYVY